MKQITNWRNATVFDVEADGLLKEATVMHVLSLQMASGASKSLRGGLTERITGFLTYHMDNGIPVIAHNGIGYDIPLCEKLLGIDLSKLMVIDTLALSWYLNTGRAAHGLDTFLEDYGIAKPKILDWENLTYDEYRVRCEEDVKINKALWDDLRDRLINMYTHTKGAVDKGLADGTRMSEDEFCYIDQYKHNSSVDEYIDRVLTFLMFKMETGQIRENTGILLDKPKTEKALKELDEKIFIAKIQLESVMPLIPKYSAKKSPKNPLKKDGTLSASGKSWNEAIEGLNEKDDRGTPLSLCVEGDPNKIKVLKSYDEPNINSSPQIKDFLYSHGWEPITFKYKKDKEAQEAWVKSGFRKDLKPEMRPIPQVSKEVDGGKELCPSVMKLAEKVPEIKYYANYTLYKHRHGVLSAYLKNEVDGYVHASVKGFTNTLREQHRAPICNLPGVDRFYGEAIRGSLTCNEGEILLGSDLSSLEDRVKHHFMMSHDPDYVSTMTDPEYDPHIKMALIAGLVSQKEFDDFMSGNKSPNAVAKRKLGKSSNYGCVYGAGPPTIAREAGIELSIAKALHKAYWELNWAVVAIADDQYTFICGQGKRWLVNPINGFCYSVRSDKDIFSTLIQGTGSFFFDIWISNVLDSMKKNYGFKRLTLLMHDEFATPVKDTEENRKIYEDITFKSIDKVNETFKLRRDLGCDVQWGKNYAEIH